MAAEKEDCFLNVMLVCDADNPAPETDPDAQARLLDSDGFTGAALLGSAVWFPTRETFVRRAVTLRLPEAAVAREWTVTGLAGGIWQVSAGGKTVLRQYVPAESGVLRILTDGGELSLEPIRS